MGLAPHLAAEAHGTDSGFIAMARGKLLVAKAVQRGMQESNKTILDRAGSKRLQLAPSHRDITSEGLEDICKVPAELSAQGDDDESARVCSRIIPISCADIWENGHSRCWNGLLLVERT